jgi:hypothetical protein
MPKPLHVPVQFITHTHTHTITHQEAAVRPSKLNNSRDMQYRKTNEFLPLISMETYTYLSKGLDRTFGLQRLKLPEFLDNQHMKVARLSALRTDRLYPSKKPPRIHFSLRLSLTFHHYHLKIPVIPSGIETRRASTNCATAYPSTCHLHFIIHIRKHNSYLFSS